MQDSRIRFLGSNPFTGLETNQVISRLTHNYATHHTYCSTIDTGCELNVSPVEPYSKRYARLRLPYSGSLGPRFPTFPVPKNLRYYAQLRLPNARLRFVRSSLSSPDTLYRSSLFVIPFGLSGKLELSSSEPGFYLYDR